MENAVNYTSNITKFSEFTYWFYRESDVKWEVVEIATGNSIGTYSQSRKCFLEIAPGHDAYELLNAVIADFDKFMKGRPEYTVGAPIMKLDECSPELREVIYDNLLMGICLRRASKYAPGERIADPDGAMPKVERLMTWIHSTDFYAAPASTKYHECYPGGLLHHTLKVIKIMMDLRAVPQFRQVSVADAIFVAAVHDWCKIGLYSTYKKNVKNEFGVWEEVEAFWRNDEIVPLGHGASSLYMAQRFFKVDIPCALAIRWHMGEYNVADNEMDALHSANETYPIVQMLQFADRLSITKY